MWYWQRYNHMTHTPCLILQSHSEPQTQSGCLIIHTSYIKCCSHTSCLILQLHPELQSQFSLHWNHLIIAHTQHWWHTTQLLGWWMATKSIIHNWQSLAIHYRYGQQHIPVYTGRSAANKWWFLPQIKAFACLLANCRLFYMGQLSGTSVLMNICSADNWPV